MSAAMSDRKIRKLAKALLGKKESPGPTARELFGVRIDLVGVEDRLERAGVFRCCECRVWKNHRQAACQCCLDACADCVGVEPM